MKKIIIKYKWISISLLCCVIVYLLCSFGKASFDIRDWSEQLRGTIATFMGFCLFMGLFTQLDE